MGVIYETINGYEIAIPDIGMFIRSGIMGKIIQKFGPIKNSKKTLKDADFSSFTETWENNRKFFYKKIETVCPECGEKLVFIECCKSCLSCGWSACC